MNRWSVVGLVASVTLAAGFGELLWGLKHGESVPEFWGAVLLGCATGSMAAISYTWAAWHRAHGSWACFVWQRRGRMVHHFHWPKESIVSCTNSAGFAGRRIR